MNSGLKLLQPCSLGLMGFGAAIEGNFTGESVSCQVSALSNRISVSSRKPVEFGLCSSSCSIPGSPTPEQIRQLCCETLLLSSSRNIWHVSSLELSNVADPVKADRPLAMTLD